MLLTRFKNHNLSFMVGQINSYIPSILTGDGGGVFFFPFFFPFFPPKFQNTTYKSQILSFLTLRRTHNKWHQPNKSTKSQQSASRARQYLHSIKFTLHSKNTFDLTQKKCRLPWCFCNQFNPIVQDSPACIYVIAAASSVLLPNHAAFLAKDLLNIYVE